MDREKQIEEMAKCCIYNDNGKCNADATESNECDLMCKMYGMFANLETAGYRKQSEVVMEIFDDILKIKGLELHDWEAIFELKKKYTDGR